MFIGKLYNSGFRILHKAIMDENLIAMEKALDGMHKLMRMLA
jgi:hypothetical protein